MHRAPLRWFGWLPTTEPEPFAVVADPEHAHVRWQATLRQQRPRVDTVLDGAPDEVAQGLLVPIAGVQHRAANDSVLAVERAFADFVPNTSAVPRVLALELHREAHGLVADAVYQVQEGS